MSAKQSRAPREGGVGRSRKINNRAGGGGGGLKIEKFTTGGVYLAR